MWAKRARATSVTLCDDTGLLLGSVAGKDAADVLRGMVVVGGWDAVSLVIAAYVDAAFFWEFRSVIAEYRKRTLFRFEMSGPELRAEYDVWTNLRCALSGTGVANLAMVPWLTYVDMQTRNRLSEVWTPTKDLVLEGESGSMMCMRLDRLLEAGCVLRRRVSRSIGGFEYEWCNPFRREERS